MMNSISLMVLMSKIIFNILIICCLIGSPNFAQEISSYPTSIHDLKEYEKIHGEKSFLLPICKKQISPQMPREDVEGTVILEVLISDSGKVDSAKIIKSLPFCDLLAIECAKQWKYEPAKVLVKDDEYINVKFGLTVPISFKRE